MHKRGKRKKEEGRKRKKKYRNNATNNFRVQTRTSGY
jgi:hypothetical protein